MHFFIYPSSTNSNNFAKFGYVGAPISENSCVKVVNTILKFFWLKIAGVSTGKPRTGASLKDQFYYKQQFSSDFHIMRTKKIQFQFFVVQKCQNKIKYYSWAVFQTSRKLNKRLWMTDGMSENLLFLFSIFSWSPIYLVFRCKRSFLLKLKEWNKYRQVE